LTSLVGRDPDDHFNRQMMLADGPDDVFGPNDVCLHGLEWEVFARRNLLQGRRVENNVGVTQHGRDAVEISYVSYAELEYLFKVVIDDFIRRGAKVAEGQTHRV